MCPSTRRTLQCRLLSSREPRRTSKRSNWCWPTAGTHLSESGVPDCVTNRVDGRGLNYEFTRCRSRFVDEDDEDDEDDECELVEWYRLAGLLCPDLRPEWL